MAIRPVFCPNPFTAPFVSETQVSFQWHAGFAKTQAQKSIISLHAAAARAGIEPVLEISSKSSLRLGVALSAFNLRFQAGDHAPMSVECAFQGSKVFERGGPYTDLYGTDSRAAKQDGRIRNSGEVIAFEFFGDKFPTQPLTAFYDLLYMIALSQNVELTSGIHKYEGFTDIAFNPKKSINCQARSVALYVALHRRGVIEQAIRNRDYYFRLITGTDTGVTTKSPQQLLLWD